MDGLEYQSELKFGANKWLIDKLVGQDDGSRDKSECPEIDVILSPVNDRSYPVSAQKFADEFISTFEWMQSQKNETVLEKNDSKYGETGGYGEYKDGSSLQISM